MTSVKSAVVVPSTATQPHSQRERQRADTRERIFQAAVAEFLRSGYGEAQIPRIAEAAGVVRGTFYFHFPTKEHVLQELQLRGQERIMEHLEALKPGVDGIPELLEAFVNGLHAGAEVVADAKLMRDTLALYVSNPMDGREHSPLVEVAAAVIAAAQEKGQVRRDLAPDAAASLVFASIFGAFAARAGAERDALLGHWMAVVGQGLAQV